MRWGWRRHSRISRIELVRYAGPKVDGRALDPPSGLVVRVRASDQDVTGVGEAVVGQGGADVAWAELERLAGSLVGAPLPSRLDPADPLAQIKGWPSVARRAGRTARAARLAAEIALLDLVLAATGQAPAGLWGGVPTPVSITWQPVLRLPGAAPGAATDQLRQQLPDAGGSWAVRLRSTGDPEWDIAWLRKLAELDRQAGRDRPLWLVGRRRLKRAAGTGLVRTVASLIREGLLPEVLLEEPVATTAPAGLIELQQVADKIIEPAPAGGSRLLVLAGASVSSPAQLRQLCADGAGVGGLCLSPARWGSWLEVRAAAQRAKATNPSMVVLLEADQGSQLTTAAATASAAVTPEIDRIVMSPPAMEWPSLARVGASPVDDRGGMCPDVDVAALSAVADRLSEHPPGDVAAQRQRANDFSDLLLPGARLGVPKQTVLETEALRAGLCTRRYTRQLFTAESDPASASIGFSGPQASATGVPAATIAQHKGLTRDLLAARGLPVAAGVWLPAGDLEKVRAAAAELGFPLVLKPADGMKGRAVTTGISTAEDLARAIDRVVDSRYGMAGVVLERMATGNDYRVLATRDEAVSVIHRVPAGVVGDGEHTVEQLVLAENVTRRTNPYLGRQLVQLDERAIALLHQQGLTGDSVPAPGSRVRLSEVANLSQGGESYEVRDSTHPSVRELAVAAVAAIPGLPYAGVDLFLTDHTLPVAEQEATIIEINHNPALLMHHYPAYGPPRNACGRLVRELAGAAGLRVQPAPDVLTIRLLVTGQVQEVGYRRWMVRVANALQLDGWVRNCAAPDQVEALIHGPVHRVAVLLRLAFGGPPRAHPTETLAEPVGTRPEPGFVLRNGRDEAGGG